jgi:hypothetical protein
MTMNSEAKYELSVLEVEMDNKEVQRKGTLLNLPGEYWSQFINKSGKDVDEKKLLENGYDGPGQVQYIREQMTELGWLGGKPAAEKVGTVEAAVAKAKAKSKARDVEDDKLPDPPEQVAFNRK